MLLSCAVCSCLSSTAAGSWLHILYTLNSLTLVLPQENIAQMVNRNDKILFETVEGASVKDTRAAEPTGKTEDGSTPQATLSDEDQEEVDEKHKSLDGEEGEDGDEGEDEVETESAALVESSDGSQEYADDDEDVDEEVEDEAEDEDEDESDKEAVALIQRDESNDDEDDEDADDDEAKEDNDDEDEDEDKAEYMPTPPWLKSKHPLQLRSKHVPALGSRGVQF